ncbi:hypothetical protein ACFWAD_11880 [Rhodococcus sp. NPDC059969]|uniref:hypothetical protein n=1 Tax=Rhodococcus sp. NPDC059969 TaxID=3347018 RepID=UPI003673157F
MSDPVLPTAESRRAWLQFVTHTRASRAFPWEFRTYAVEDVQWDEELPDPEARLRVTDLSPGVVELWSTGFAYLGEARVEIDPDREGALYARRSPDEFSITLYYHGPNDLLLAMLHRNQ